MFLTRQRRGQSCWRRCRRGSPASMTAKLLRWSAPRPRAPSSSGSCPALPDERFCPRPLPHAGEAHATIYKVLSMLGLGRERILRVSSDDQGRAYLLLASEHRQGSVEVLNEVVQNQVVVAFGDDDGTRRVIASIQDAGGCWCGGTTWRGRAVARPHSHARLGWAAHNGHCGGDSRAKSSVWSASSFSRKLRFGWAVELIGW